MLSVYTANLQNFPILQNWNLLSKIFHFALPIISSNHHYDFCFYEFVCSRDSIETELFCIYPLWVAGFT